MDDMMGWMEECGGEEVRLEQRGWRSSEVWSRRNIEEEGNECRRQDDDCFEALEGRYGREDGKMNE